MVVSILGGRLPAGVLAVLIAELARGHRLRDSLDVAKTTLRQSPDHGETLEAIERAESLARSTTPIEKAIRTLGEGWIAEEALSIAMYAVLAGGCFEHTVTVAVNHDGDSDSTGSIAGQIAGTLLGVESIPQPLLDELERREVIEALADDLLDSDLWHFSKVEPWNARTLAAWERYVGPRGLPGSS